MIEITAISKIGGPLTKRISLRDGSLVGDGSACVMSRGRASRVVLPELRDVAKFIHQLDSTQAIALGTLRNDLSDTVNVTTQDDLTKTNGKAPPDLIARNSSFISYEAGKSALALIDIDTKGMTDEVKAEIKEVGGFWNALISVMPALATAGRIVRKSTSTGIQRSDTGEKLTGSSGAHIFIHVQDGSDVERFLRTLHERCWLAGFGWHMVGTGGQLLDRSLVDRMVYAAERLVFEGPPILDAPLIQDQASRCPDVFDGVAIDTAETCPALRIVETTRLKELKARSSHALASKRAEAREAFIAKMAGQLATKKSIPLHIARRIVDAQCEGLLLPDVALAWDDEQLAGCTVGDVMADPARFVGATLADPLEGPIYGRTKAKVMRRADGSPWINSFAHGRTTYELRYDARSIQDAIDRASSDEVVGIFTKMATMATLTKDEVEALRNAVAKISGTGKRTLDQQLKQAAEEKDKGQKREDQERRAAERQDQRPQVPAPLPDAPFIPQMEALNDVLGSSTALEPPMRDIDGNIAQVMVRRVPNMHALTCKGSNEEEAAETRLPPPEQPLLSKLDEAQIVEMIERHVDYIDPTGRSVHLGPVFCKHYAKRDDAALPTVAAIATLPIVLPDGTLLTRRGLDRERGIVFRVPQQLQAIMPKTADCTDAAVVEAMRFLTEELLADVATNYVGKCTLIAAALTIIERTLLPERPTYFINAGRRGSGKTTTITMLLTAVTGVRPSAAAWSSSDEERRKALLSYLSEAVPSIVWDNIPRGTQIACPHIEKACTSAFYSDRRLGFTQMLSVAASSIHIFTGNNVGPRGDMASRSLQVRLEVDRPDPENRRFRHDDPVEWTEANRGRILRALFTLLLGNPAVRPQSNVKPETRFKLWWKLCGSAVEHAADLHQQDEAERVAACVCDPSACPPVAINFRDLFLQQEEDDEESSGLAEALKALAEQWPREENFQASDLAKLLNDQSSFLPDHERERASTLREFLYADAPASQVITSKGVGKRLKKHNGEPVAMDGGVYCLKTGADPHTKVATFYVHVV